MHCAVLCCTVLYCTYTHRCTIHIDFIQIQYFFLMTSLFLSCDRVWGPMVHHTPLLLSTYTVQPTALPWRAWIRHCSHRVSAPHLILSYDVMSSHIKSYHVISYYVMWHYTISYHSYFMYTDTHILIMMNKWKLLLWLSSHSYIWNNWWLLLYWYE